MFFICYQIVIKYTWKVVFDWVRALGSAHPYIPCISINNLIESLVSHSSLARCLSLVISVVHLTEQSCFWMIQKKCFVIAGHSIDRDWNSWIVEKDDASCWGRIRTRIWCWRRRRSGSSSSSSSWVTRFDLTAVQSTCNKVVSVIIFLSHFLRFRTMEYVLFG